MRRTLQVSIEGNDHIPDTRQIAGRSREGNKIAVDLDIRLLSLCGADESVKSQTRVISLFR